MSTSVYDDDNFILLAIAITIRRWQKEEQNEAAQDAYQRVIDMLMENMKR